MIYVTGDIHGDLKRFNNRSIRKMTDKDHLIVCGDFGFIWNNSKEEKKILEKLKKKKYTILFADGAYENFELLESYSTQNWNGGNVHKIADNIYHLMRGEVYTIEGKRIFVFGGGEIDETDGYRDFIKDPEKQTPSAYEMKNGIANLAKYGNSVDYIITHFPCPGVKKQVQNRTILDTYLSWIEKNVKYRKWFFGSLHINRRFTLKSICLFDEAIAVE